MNNTITVDARGLSCPQPAMMAKGAIRNAQSGTVEVLVSDPTARENIRRIAGLSGWSVEIEELPGDEFRLVLTQ